MRFYRIKKEAYLSEKGLGPDSKVLCSICDYLIKEETLYCQGHGPLCTECKKRFKNTSTIVEYSYHRKTQREISVRAGNVIINNGVESDLALKHSWEDGALWKWRGCGNKTITEIGDYLKRKFPDLSKMPRKLACVFLVFFCLQAKAIEQDKMLHFSVSYGLSYTGMHLLPDNKKYLAPALVLVLGLFKELTDSGADGKDMIANTLGIGTSIIIFHLE